jgi:large subunit ribosomal protein L15
VKVLGDGEIGRPVKVFAHKFSKTAVEKITAAGGEAKVIEC